MTTTMTRDQVWQAVDAQRTALADILDQLSDDDWRRPSLCRGWTVRDVAARLTLQKFPIPLAVSEVFRARGNMDRAIHDSSCRRAKEPVEQLIARLRDMVGRHRPVLGMTYHEALIDQKMFRPRQRFAGSGWSPAISTGGPVRASRSGRRSCPCCSC
jgi:uncharacterized protein (TIGR03083 family)